MASLVYDSSKLNCSRSLPWNGRVQVRIQIGKESGPPRTWPSFYAPAAMDPEGHVRHDRRRIRMDYCRQAPRNGDESQTFLSLTVCILIAK
jgi:hypothetical protein